MSIHDQGRGYLESPQAFLSCLIPRMKTKLRWQRQRLASFWLDTTWSMADLSTEELKAAVSATEASIRAEGSSRIGKRDCSSTLGKGLNVNM